MHRATVARNAIGPLLDQLIAQLGSEGSATQRAFFDRIRRSLYRAADDISLVTPIRELSTTPRVGFRFSDDADVLINRIAEKANALAIEMQPQPDDPVVH